MSPPGADKVRDALSQGHCDRAVALLQQVDPAVAAGVMMGIPFEEQRVLFRVMPDDFAATLVSQFPYYHSYVLLHTRSLDTLRAIIGKMQPGERLMFFDGETMSGRPGKLLFTVPRDAVSVNGLNRGLLTLKVELAIEGQDRGLRLVFPTAARKAGEQAVGVLRAAVPSR